MLESWQAGLSFISPKFSFALHYLCCIKKETNFVSFENQNGMNLNWTTVAHLDNKCKQRK